MSLAFHVAHTTGGRTRIKWAGEHDDRAAVVDVAAQIAAIEGVDQAVPRPTTGSIIIEHDRIPWARLETELADRLSLRFDTPAMPEPRTGIDTVNRGIDHANGALRAIHTDLGSVTVVLMLILAVTQAVRGQVMGSSVSFLWYALSVATMSRGVHSPARDTQEGADA